MNRKENTRHFFKKNRVYVRFYLKPFVWYEELFVEAQVERSTICNLYTCRDKQRANKKLFTL